jgi:hypothetical protein
MVTWHEPGSSDTLEPFANVHHLDALVEYELRLEASCKTAGVKGTNRAEAAHYKYLLQRNKEAAALNSEDDTDTEASEPEQLPRMSLGGSTSSLGTPAALSLDSPVSSDQQGWDDLLEAGDWMLEGNNWMEAAELFRARTVAALPCKPRTVPGANWWK